MNIEQFPKVKPENKEEKKYTEKKDIFAQAVEQIKSNERAVKLLVLMEKGYLPSQGELPTIDIERLCVELRKKYPTIEDLEDDLITTVEEEISVAFQVGWTPEQYRQAIREKKLQYQREAVKGIIKALGPVYEKFGALSSEENKERIIKNLTSVIENIDPRNISASQREYVKNNILAAVNQDLSPDEARRILQIQKTFFEVYRQSFSESQPDLEIETAIQRIKEKSGLRLEELKEELGLTEKDVTPEKFELKGEKIEIEYPGMPIDVYLADKRLQIIDVRNDERWNADYLLIDPLTFDQMAPVTGYKGIRENEPFILGRENPFRFEFPKTVSRNHLKIELKNDKLYIEDLGSTNGTVIYLKKPKRLNKEQIETEKFSPEKEQTITAFREYVKKHQQEIEKALEQGRDLDELFYRDFYSRDIDKLKYNPDDPNVQRLEQIYGKQVEETKAILLRDAQKIGGIEIIVRNYWLYCNINGGYRNPEALGRFYFNLKPEYVGEFFKRAVRMFREAGLHVQMKIPLEGSSDMFNRFDKMVLYFDADEESDILNTLEYLYYENRDSFDTTGIPRFTMEVKNEKGDSLVGIGFGEEPPFRNESFGTIRAKILTEVYLDAKYSGLSIDDPHFDFESSFRRACVKYQVDPQNPAFNLLRDSKKFAELKRRIKNKF